MRLLFDENLSTRLPEQLADVYPGSLHVVKLGLGGAADTAVWERAMAAGLVLVTKDEDFHRLSVLRGPPPKVIWIRLGNCGTRDIVRLLRLRRDEVADFVGSATTGLSGARLTDRRAAAQRCLPQTGELW